MNIKKIIKNDNGVFNVDCEFSEDEYNTIMEIGLNVLLASGALPFQETEEVGVYEVIPPSELAH